jgi:hypothetical protein
MDVVNTRAYYDTATIAAVKSLKQAWARSFNDDTSMDQNDTRFINTSENICF